MLSHRREYVADRFRASTADSGKPVFSDDLMVLCMQKFPSRCEQQAIDMNEYAQLNKQRHKDRECIKVCQHLCGEIEFARKE